MLGKRSLMTFETIIYEIEGGIATITLNRPAVLNAINHKMSHELNQALDLADVDTGVRVVVIRGAGKAFSAGADLRERAERPDLESDPERQIADFRRSFAYLKIWDLSKPVIAAVHGYCLAGACQMVGMCDLTIASDDAVFGEPEVKFSNPILLPITALLLGLKKAKEFLFLGELMSASEAERLGMVNKVVPRDQLEVETGVMARKLAAIPAAGIRLNKRAVNRIWEAMGLKDGAYASQELLAYVFAYQSFSGTDEGFREKTRKHGLRSTLHTPSQFPQGELPKSEDHDVKDVTRSQSPRRRSNGARN